METGISTATAATTPSDLPIVEVEPDVYRCLNAEQSSDALREAIDLARSVFSAARRVHVDVVHDADDRHAQATFVMEIDCPMQAAEFRTAAARTIESLRSGSLYGRLAFLHI
jgi:hypothetical protein